MRGLVSVLAGIALCGAIEIKDKLLVNVGVSHALRDCGPESTMQRCQREIVGSQSTAVTSMRNTIGLWNVTSEGGFATLKESLISPKQVMVVIEDHSIIGPSALPSPFPYNYYIEYTSKSQLELGGELRWYSLRQGATLDGQDTGNSFRYRSNEISSETGWEVEHGKISGESDRFFMRARRPFASDGLYSGGFILMRLDGGDLGTGVKVDVAYAQILSYGVLPYWGEYANARKGLVKVGHTQEKLGTVMSTGISKSVWCNFSSAKGFDTAQYVHLVQNTGMCLAEVVEEYQDHLVGGEYCGQRGWDITLAKASSERLKSSYLGMGLTHNNLLDATVKCNEKSLRLFQLYADGTESCQENKRDFDMEFTPIYNEKTKYHIGAVFRPKNKDSFKTNSKLRITFPWSDCTPIGSVGGAIESKASKYGIITHGFTRTLFGSGTGAIESYTMPTKGCSVTCSEVTNVDDCLTDMENEGCELKDSVVFVNMDVTAPSCPARGDGNLISLPVYVREGFYVTRVEAMVTHSTDTLSKEYHIGFIRGTPMQCYHNAKDAELSDEPSKIEHISDGNSMITWDGDETFQGPAYNLLLTSEAGGAEELKLVSYKIYMSNKYVPGATGEETTTPEPITTTTTTTEEATTTTTTTEEATTTTTTTEEATTTTTTTTTEEATTTTTTTTEEATTTTTSTEKPTTTTETTTTTTKPTEPAVTTTAGPDFEINCRLTGALTPPYCYDFCDPINGEEMTLEECVAYANSQDEMCIASFVETWSTTNVADPCAESRDPQEFYIHAYHKAGRYNKWNISSLITQFEVEGGEGDCSDPLAFSAIPDGACSLEGIDDDDITEAPLVDVEWVDDTHVTISASFLGTDDKRTMMFAYEKDATTCNLLKPVPDTQIHSYMLLTSA